MLPRLLVSFRKPHNILTICIGLVYLHLRSLAVHPEVDRGILLAFLHTRPRFPLPRHVFCPG
jgi:hypothetical protein